MSHLPHDSKTVSASLMKPRMGVGALLAGIAIMYFTAFLVN